LTIGNPPFGNNSSKAIGFFNHAARFSQVVAYILPMTFRKESVTNRLDLSFELHAELELKPNSFIFLGGDYPIQCVFQIWVKSNKLRQVVRPVKETSDFVFVKPDKKYDLVIRRVGVNAGLLYDDLTVTYSEQSHLFLQVKPFINVKDVYDRLVSLTLHKSPIKFYTAGNPSLSANEICNLYESGNDSLNSSSSDLEPVSKRFKSSA
jgi:hypothetical protein